MYGGKISGPTVLTGGAVVAGSQIGLAPFVFIAIALMLAGFIVARVAYHRRHPGDGEA